MDQRVVKLARLVLHYERSLLAVAVAQRRECIGDERYVRPVRTIR